MVFSLNEHMSYVNKEEKYTSAKNDVKNLLLHNFIIIFREF